VRALNLGDVRAGPLGLRPDDVGASGLVAGGDHSITPVQLGASAKAPCTSTIAGRAPVCEDWSVMFTGEPPAVSVG